MAETVTLPTVSVVLPTFNAAAYLGETMGSALAQRFADFELLVLDNASTDDTAGVVARFTDARVRYRRNSMNEGYAGNIEIGRSLARGRYVVVLNADDIWERDYLARTVARLDREPRLSFVHTRTTLIDERGRPFGEQVTKWDATTPGKEAFLNCFHFGFSSPTMLIRNDVLRSVPRLPTGEPWGPVADSWLFLQLCLRGDVGHVGTPLLRYRVHESSLSFELYADGSFFQRRLANVRDAFVWPAVQAWAAERDRDKVIRHVAREVIQILPAIRSTNTRLRLLRAFGQILGKVPSVMLYPETWARLGYGLLPRRAIRSLRARKRSRWASRNLRWQPS